MMERHVIIDAIREARGTVAQAEALLATDLPLERHLAIMEYKWDAEEAISNMEHVLATTKDGE